MTGIERHWIEEDKALMDKLEREHGGYFQQIEALRSKLYPGECYANALAGVGGIGAYLNGLTTDSGQGPAQVYFRR